MLKGFQYQGNTYRNPGALDYEANKSEQKQEDGIGGLMDLIGQGETMGLFDSFKGMDAPNVGPQLPGAEGAASSEGGGWMSGMFGGEGGGMEAVKSAMSNPWTALAAVIIGNEIFQTDQGNRAEDPVQHGTDLATGAVAAQDMEQMWLPGLGLDEGSTENNLASNILDPAGNLMDAIF